MYGDGILRYRDGVSVAQVVCFSLSLAFAYHFQRTKRIGWFCIGSFSIIRIVSASCFLALINSDSANLRATVFVCESLGIMLLIFVFFELLATMNNAVSVLHRRAFLVPQLLTWVDIGVSIGGYVAVKNKNHDQLEPTPYDQASRAVIIAIYVYIVALLAMLWYKGRKIFGQAENRAFACIAICIPFMVIRLTYSLIFEATGGMTFSPIKGNPTAYLLMTFLPELCVVAICVATIVRISPSSRLDAPGREESGGGKNGQGSTITQHANDHDRLIAR